MNEKHKSYNITDNDETIKKKSINSNNVNKKVVDKNTKRKQKRLFQMHKRLALFNEEDLPELTSENNTKYISNDINNFNSSKNCTQIQSKNKFPTEKNNLSYNFNNAFKDNLNIEKIQHKKALENQKNLKKNLENKTQEQKESPPEIQNIKEDEPSLKKKNTYSNTNDEDKSSTEALFPNEIDFNQKKSKSIFQNDSVEGEGEGEGGVFTKIIHGDMDENPNIFSASHDNNEIDEINTEKEDIEFQEENIMNNFNFANLINNNDINDNCSKEDDDDNMDNNSNNSVIINETDQEDKKEINEDDSNNVELNISNLEIDINEINEESNTQNEEDFTNSVQNSNEFAKKYLSSKSKSFIKFNNNLTARVAANNSKNSMSYMLALCPELMGEVDKKNLIKENYAVTDAISEDIEAENFTPRQSEKYEEINIRNTIGEKNINNESINTNNYLSNKTFRNREIKYSSNFPKKEIQSPKTHYKNRSKIYKNTLKNIIDVDNNNNINIKENKKLYTNNNKYNSINNNSIYNNYNTNYEKCKNNIIKKPENLKIKYHHQKAKSSINNNNQIDSFNLNLNSNQKNKQHSPKQTSEIFNKKNTLNKILHKNTDKKNKKIIIEQDKETEQLNYKQNYSSNDNNKKNNPKFIKKCNSNVYSNTMVKSHNYCKSDLRDKIFDIKKKYTFIRRTNANTNMNDLSKSNIFVHKKNNDNNKICFTEKTNKSKNYTSFISHIKKNTPDNINNISEQNIINHSKKLSQQIADGYKFFSSMNSINTNSNANNKNNNNSKKNIKRRIYSNNFTIKSTPLSNYFSFNKNKINTNINTVNTTHNNNITFIKKNALIKNDKGSHIIPNHNKSKTSFIAPSFRNNLNTTKNKLLKKNYTLINSNKKKNEISAKNIKKNYIKKINNKFNEIKKVVNDSSLKIIHKKINTIGQPNELTKLLNNNSNNSKCTLKDSSSNSNYKNNFNKHKVIKALQHIKFLHKENYSKVLNELYKSKKNLFVILVYLDSNKKFIFKGLYEVNSTEQKTANKLIANEYGQYTLNVTKFNNFFNYNKTNGEFVRIKFSNDNEKKFSADTIVVY